MDLQEPSPPLSPSSSLLQAADVILHCVDRLDRLRAKASFSAAAVSIAQTASLVTHTFLTTLPLPTGQPGGSPWEVPIPALNIASMSPEAGGKRIQLTVLNGLRRIADHFVAAYKSQPSDAAGDVTASVVMGAILAIADAVIALAPPEPVETGSGGKGSAGLSAAPASGKGKEGKEAKEEKGEGGGGEGQNYVSPVVTGMGSKASKLMGDEAKESTYCLSFNGFQGQALFSLSLSYSPSSLSPLLLSPPLLSPSLPLSLSSSLSSLSSLPLTHTLAPSHKFS